MKNIKLIQRQEGQNKPLCPGGELWCSAGGGKWAMSIICNNANNSWLILKTGSFIIEAPLELLVCSYNLQILIVFWSGNVCAASSVSDLHQHLMCADCCYSLSPFASRVKIVALFRDSMSPTGKHLRCWYITVCQSKPKQIIQQKKKYQIFLVWRRYPEQQHLRRKPSKWKQDHVLHISHPGS